MAEKRYKFIYNNKCTSGPMHYLEVLPKVGRETSGDGKLDVEELRWSGRTGLLVTDEG